MPRHIAEGMKACPFCAEEIRVEAIKCRYCGEGLPVAVVDPPPAAAPPPEPGPAPASPFAAQPEPQPRVVLQGDLPASIYASDAELEALGPEVRRGLQAHEFRTRIPVWLAVLLGLVTINVFFSLYYSTRHQSLPKVVRNDPSGFMAFILLFVPFVNFYWIFFVWTRLADRLNLQLRLRGLPPTVNRVLPMWVGGSILVAVFIAGVFPDVALFLWCLNWFVLVPLCIAGFQGAINTLVKADHA